LLEAALRALGSIERARRCAAWRPVAPDLLGRLGPDPQGLAGGVPRAAPQPPSRPRRQRRRLPGEDRAGTAPHSPALPVNVAIRACGLQARRH